MSNTVTKPQPPNLTTNVAKATVHGAVQGAAFTPSSMQPGKAALSAGSSSPAPELPTGDKADTAADSAAEAARRKSLRPLLAIAPYVLRYRSTLVLAGIAMFVSAIAMLVVPTAVRRMIDFGFAGRDGGFINQYFLVMILIGLLLAVAASARFYLVNWLGERVVSDVRTDVFRHLSTLGPAFFEKTHSGELMSRLTADTTLIKSAAGSTISQAVRNTIMLSGALVMMFFTSQRLSLIVLGVIPLIVLPLIGYGRVVRRLSRRAQDELADASSYAAENLSAVRTMQAFGHESHVVARFGRAVESAFEAANVRLKARAGLTGGAMFLVVASIVGVLWYGASMVVSGEMTGGRLSQFVLYAVFAGGALAELSEVWGEVSQAAGAAERLTELLAVVPDIQSPPHPVPLPHPARGEIVFDEVRFAYPSRPDTNALDAVSFRVAPGETVAIVGPSGAGKSTILNLILRFYDVSSGAVRVDGVAVGAADVADLRARMALVPQDVALFADTVAENIRYGTPETTDADVQAAAVKAQADGFIRALPLGYATRLGERGVTLSGGQRQRIALARAILRDSPILLLDEATSALDAENEVLVQAALDVVMAGRTTIVIAHRLSTIQKADRILVLDKGRIVETGTHATLSRAGGLYARLADLQFGLEKV
jgi:ATP-binding cassette, subfamily B, bacterial